MKARLQRSVLTLTAIALLSAAAHAQTSATGTLKGVVTEPGGGVITGALVRIVSWGPDDQKLKIIEKEAAVHTDVNGQFRFELPAGICDVFVSDPDFAPAMKQVNVDARKIVVFNVKLKFSRYVQFIP